MTKERLNGNNNTHNQDVRSTRQKRFSTGKTELLVDYALDEETLQQIVVPCVHPSELGGIFDVELGEWRLHD